MKTYAKGQCQFQVTFLHTTTNKGHLGETILVCNLSHAVLGSNTNEKVSNYYYQAKVTGRILWVCASSFNSNTLFIVKSSKLHTFQYGEEIISRQSRRRLDEVEREKVGRNRNISGNNLERTKIKI